MVARNNKEIQCARFTLNFRKIIGSFTQVYQATVGKCLYQKRNVGAREMAQQAKYWPHKHVDWSCDPHHQCKKLSGH